MNFVKAHQHSAGVASDENQGIGKSVAVNTTKIHMAVDGFGQRNGTLYVGSTSDLVKRVWAHKNKVIAGFTEKHNVNQLVYYERHDL